MEEATGPVSMADLPLPLAAIDFEASSLEWDGYPIEVGIAVWQAPGAPLLGWSALIRPTRAWREGGHWSRASARVHGIGGRELQDQGLPPDTVANVLNTVLEPVGTAWCDGSPYDVQWAGALFKAAGCRAGFLLLALAAATGIPVGPAEDLPHTGATAMAGRAGA